MSLTVFLIPERLSSEARARFMLRFRRQAEVLTALTHPYILPVYEYGEYGGYPYFITPYMMQGSLDDTLKQQGRYAPESVVKVLEQVAAGLEYAHSKGVIHGTLKPAHILLSGEQTFLLAGFGLRQILQMCDVEPCDQPHAHLLSIDGTFLDAVEYLAPEVVQGQSIERSSDIYALGIILFELLSGKVPFTGSSFLEVAAQHVQGSLPSLHMLCPTIPMTTEVVVNRALKSDPARRFQSAHELAEAFAQAWKGTAPFQQQHTAQERLHPLNQIQPPTVPHTDMRRDALDEPSSGSWQLVPPIVSGKIPAVWKNTASTPTMVPLGKTPKDGQTVPFTHTEQASSTGKFAQVAPASPLEQTTLTSPTTVQDSPPQMASSSSSARPSRFSKRSHRMSRRQATTWLTLGVVATGVTAAVNINHIMDAANAVAHLFTRQGAGNSSSSSQYMQMPGGTQMPGMQMQGGNTMHPSPTTKP